MNEPKLRFKGFEGEWESISIEEVSPLQGGFAFQSTSFRKYGIPIVRISNILNTGEIGVLLYSIKVSFLLNTLCLKVMLLLQCLELQRVKPQS